MTTNKLWLYDSRNRPHHNSPRILRVYPATPMGFEAAWEMVVCAEIEDLIERGEYLDFGHGMFDHEGEDERVDQEEDALAFNQYWGCYGWYIAVMDHDEPEPDVHDIIIG